MNLSVASTFEPGIIPRIAAYPQVDELFGKLHKDPSGKLWPCSLKQTNPKILKKSVQEAHSYGLGFNYLLNNTDLIGLEQSHSKQKQIGAFIDFLSKIEIDTITVSTPFLLRLLKNRYTGFRVEVDTSAQICTALEARQWEDLGADSLVISPLKCNRNFEILSQIRAEVSCELKLVANAGCLLNCVFENSHRHILSGKTRIANPTRLFFLDYCFLHCTSRKILNPANLIRSCWIRPEDISFYEKMGYTSFRILERNCPGDLLLKRVKAYTKRSFSGNLMDLTGPVSDVKMAQSFFSKLGLFLSLTFSRSRTISPSLVSVIHKYMAWLNPSENSLYPVVINNKKLDGFLEDISQIKCGAVSCSHCNYCAKVASQAVKIDQEYHNKIVALVQQLDSGLICNS